MNRPAASLFHPGEQAVQARLGVRAAMEDQGARIIRDHLTEQHRDFYPLLPFLVVGATDGEGQPWATLIAGEPGFVTAPDEHHLSIGALPLPGDPLRDLIRPGAELGALGIQLSTRRRNRVNGVVGQVSAGGFTLTVRQAFGNCPQYIQLREVSPAAVSPAEPVVGFDAWAAAMVRDADTFFIATASGAAGGTAGGVDVSHRGGKPGFVRVDGDRLTIPDFSGNNMFNSIGNLMLDPRAGLVFPDFASGALLHLAGIAELVWDGPEVAAFAGAQRLIRFRVARSIRRDGALPLHFGAPRYSPVLARTGEWLSGSTP